MPKLFFDQNAMILEINYKKKTAKNPNMWRLNNMLLSNQWLTEEIKEEEENKIPQALWPKKKSNHEGRRIQMQGFKNLFEIKR